MCWWIAVFFLLLRSCVFVFCPLSIGRRVCGRLPPRPAPVSDMATTTAAPHRLHMGEPGPMCRETTHVCTSENAKFCTCSTVDLSSKQRQFNTGMCLGDIDADGYWPVFAGTRWRILTSIKNRHSPKHFTLHSQQETRVNSYPIASSLINSANSSLLFFYSVHMTVTSERPTSRSASSSRWCTTVQARQPLWPSTCTGQACSISRRTTGLPPTSATPPPACRLRTAPSTATPRPSLPRWIQSPTLATGLTKSACTTPALLRALTDDGSQGFRLFFWGGREMRWWSVSLQQKGIHSTGG